MLLASHSPCYVEQGSNYGQLTESKTVLAGPVTASSPSNQYQWRVYGDKHCSAEKA